MHVEKASVRQETNEVDPNGVSANCGDPTTTCRAVLSLFRGLNADVCDGLKRLFCHRLWPGVLILAVLSVWAVGEEIEGDKPEVPAFDEFLVISEKNMFSSRRGNAFQFGRKKSVVSEFSQTSQTGFLPPNVEVIGIVKTSDPLSSIAIIKDSGRHVPCRVGDTVGGMLITQIRSSEIFFETEEGTQIARLQPGATPDGSGTPTSLATLHKTMPLLAGETRRVPLDISEIRRLARTLPRVIHREDGPTGGLQLTEDVMGLREGDRVTAVGGQSLDTKYPKQKLLQITRKYQQYGQSLPEISVVIERDDQEMEFVLVPAS